MASSCHRRYRLVGDAERTCDVGGDSSAVAADGGDVRRRFVADAAVAAARDRCLGLSPMCSGSSSHRC